MNDPLPPDLPVGVPGALGTLRHALADPLSAAGLKLELLERRLASVTPDGSLADRVRSTKADVAAAGRLINLLPRLARIAGEAPVEASIGDLCRVAGIPLGEPAGGLPRVLLRRLASIDSLRTLLGILRSPDPGVPPPRVSAEVSPGRVSLRIETLGGSGERDPERLFHLPPGLHDLLGQLCHRGFVLVGHGLVEALHHGPFQPQRFDQGLRVGDVGDQEGHIHPGQPTDGGLDVALFPLGFCQHSCCFNDGIQPLVNLLRDNKPFLLTCTNPLLLTIKQAGGPVNSRLAQGGWFQGRWLRSLISGQ